MDALALLCNLHGDGPVTLAALRDLGCEDLVGLDALGESLLGEILGRDESGVQRFRREARLLSERLDGEPADEARPPSVVIAPQPPPVASPDSSSASERETPAEETPADSETGPVVSAVLDLWRQLDDRVEPKPTSNLLAEVSLSGLKPEDVVALARAGVRTLDELSEADLLSLTKRSELPYTHVAHLAFLARKLQKEGQGAGQEPSPSITGELQGAREGQSKDGPAGPFA